MRIPPIMLILLFSVLSTSCCTSPEKTSETTKGQKITRCLDTNSIEECDRRYNP